MWYGMVRSRGLPTIAVPPVPPPPPVVNNPPTKLAAAMIAILASTWATQAPLPIARPKVPPFASTLGFDGTARILNGKFVNGGGYAQNYRGASCYEGGYENGSTNIWDNTGWPGSPPSPDFALFKATWRGNIVRLAISSQSWLSQNCLKLSSIPMVYSGANNIFTLPTTIGSSPVFVNKNADGQYQQKLKSVVDLLTSLGFVVILDLHYWSNDVVIGGTTYHVHNNGGAGQQPLPDGDTALTFWTQCATAYKGYANVIFEVANEPGSSIGINWNQWLNGFTGTQLWYNDGSSIGTSGQGFALITGSWKYVGHQALVDTVRATGATNIIICQGIEYGSELGNNGFADTSGATWLSSKPNDSINQLACGVHFYPNANSAYGNANYNRWYNSDPNSGTSFRQFIPFFNQINAAGIPIIITEFGGANGPVATFPNELFVSDVQNQIDAFNASNGAGSVGGLCWAYTPNGTTSMIITSGSTVVPNGGTGKAFFPWISGHAAP